MNSIPHQMMKTILVVLAIGLSGSAFAQSKMAASKSPMHQMTSKNMDGSVMMKEGKMICTMNGKTIPMEKTMTMSNGTQVMADGMVKMKNGKTVMLKNGQCVMMNGKVTSMPMKMSKM